MPVLLHLRRRRARRRVPFPAVRYLQRAREARARSLRATDLLLLAVRVLLVAALAGAAAGPLLGRGEPGDHVPTDLAVVLDNTASTARLAGEAPLLSLLRARARDGLAAARPEDRVWLVPVVGEPAAAGVRPEEARAAVGRVPGTDAGGDLARAVERAAALLTPRQGRAREVHLLSDLQATGLGSRPGAVSGPAAPTSGPPGAAFGRQEGPADGPSGGADAAPPPLVVFRPPELPAANGAVVALEPPPGGRVAAGLAGTVTALTRRFGPPPGPGAEASDGPAGAAEEERARVRLEVDGRTAAAVEAPWGAPVALRLPAGLASGLHAGRVEIEPSGLRSDDVRHLTFRVAPPPAVRFEGPPDGFLALGLETLARAGRVSIGDAGTGRSVAVLQGASPEVLAAGGGTLAAAAAERILVPPADPVRLPAFERLLAGLEIPWRLRPEAAGGERRLAGAALADVPGLEATRVTRRYRLEPAGAGAAGDSVLLRTDDGEPWLVRGRANGRVHLLLASPLVPEATDLPTSAAMIPWLEALLLRWGDAGPRIPDVEAGAAVRLPDRALAVELPEGDTVEVEGGAPFVPLRAGLHRVRLAGGDDLAFAANLPPAESDLAALETGPFPELIPGGEVVMAGPGPDAWRGAVFRSRRGADGAPWLLGLALLLVAAEAALAAPGRRGESRAP